jgi:hypothetical protein
MATLGTTRQLTAEFTAHEVPTDPTDVFLTITAPDGTVTTPTPSHDGTGRYSYELLLDQEGLWTVRWEGTGTVPVVFTSTIAVSNPSQLTPGCEPWIDWDDLDCDAASSITDPELQAMILGYVTDVLYSLSCSQFGSCAVKARPCLTRSWYTPWPWFGASHLVPYDGWWPTGNYGCTSCHQRGIELGSAPIVDVIEVKVDGEVLDPSAYRVDNNWELVRLDGLSWPVHQDLLLDDTEVGTWSVTWQYGTRVPPGGILAAKLYACEVVKAVNGEECALPPGTTSVSRDGVSVNIIDSTEAAASGKTGLIVVDMWLQSVCPGGPEKRSGAMDPGRRGRKSVRVGT